jgi:hypothetical protein
MQAIRSILLGNEQETQAPTARPSNAGRAEQFTAMASRTANDEFVEAIVIAQFTRLQDPRFPLGHLRQNKMVYFAHRRADEKVAEHFLKKPAGPYSPWATYKGPERIAQRNGYIRRARIGNLVGYVAGQNIDKIDRYISRYPVCGAVEWVFNTFRYRRNEQLELLATVDFAALELIEKKRAVTMENVRNVIATSTEWVEKLKREVFSDENITKAIEELQVLFPATYA